MRSECYELYERGLHAAKCFCDQVDVNPEIKSNNSEDKESESVTLPNNQATKDNSDNSCFNSGLLLTFYSALSFFMVSFCLAPKLPSEINLKPQLWQ